MIKRHIKIPRYIFKKMKYRVKLPNDKWSQRIIREWQENRKDKYD